jgi:hypothetical protein
MDQQDIDRLQDSSKFQRGAKEAHSATCHTNSKYHKKAVRAGEQHEKTVRAGEQHEKTVRWVSRLLKEE